MNLYITRRKKDGSVLGLSYAPNIIQVSMKIQKHLNVGALKTVMVPLPPIDLQKRFATTVENIEKQENRERRSPVPGKKIGRRKRVERIAGGQASPGGPLPGSRKPPGGLPEHPAGPAAGAGFTHAASPASQPPG